MKDLFKELYSFSRRKKLTIVIFAAAVGIVLILLSELFPKQSGEKSKDTTQFSEIISTDEYQSQLEEKLTGVIGSIEGVGKLRVMITLKSTVCYIYETNRKNEKEINTDSDGTDEVQKSDTAVTMYQDSGGKDKALISSIVMPQINGVTVVCEGGNRAAVCESVINAVSTSLGISASRVYVTKYKTEETR